MKAFVAPSRTFPLCAWIGLDRISLVGLDWLGVSEITVGDEEASELSVAALDSHRHDTKCLELLPLVHGWHSSSTFPLLPSSEEVFRGHRMASHPKLTTISPFHFFILHSSSAKLLSFLPWISIWSFLKRASSSGNSPFLLWHFLSAQVTPCKEHNGNLSTN